MLIVHVDHVEVHLVHSLLVEELVYHVEVLVLVLVFLLVLVYHVVLIYLVNVLVVMVHDQMIVQMYLFQTIV